MFKVRMILLNVVLSVALTAGAQVQERTFYVDFGQNNVSGQGYKTTGADKNKHYWNNIFGKGTGAPDKAYPQTINLLTSDNKQTDLRLQLSSRFSTNGYTNGGLQSPSAALLGDLAIESATQDYIFLEGGQDYSVINFKGFDPAKAYRFHFFGSRTATDTRAADFELSGENIWKGELVMSGTGIGNNGYNGNNNKVLASDYVFPNRDGNIFLTISKKSSGIMVYLNCMKIEEVSGLERPNQELSLVQKMYFDFGEINNNTRGHATTGKDANGNYWNNINSGTSSSNAIPANKTLAIKNQSNESTGARFVVVDKTYSNGIDAGGNNNPTADDLGDLAIKTATEDYIFIDNSDVRSFRLTKLNTDHCYRFYIYGSRNTDADRCALYTIAGQRSWAGGQTTSGSSIGGEGYNGNLRNILQSDYIYPDKNGNILITMQRLMGMAHISAMRVEEYEGGTRPEEPLVFSSLQLSGNAEDATFKVLGNNIYEVYARLTAGNFTLSGQADGETVELSDNGDGTFGTSGSTPFSVAKDCVARITVNTAASTVTVMPVTMNVRGNIAAGNPAVPYKGAGVFQGEVTLPETSSQQWVDKTMYFALNNNDAFAIKRLKGASTRYDLGEVEKGQSTENIYQNAGTYTITVDMNQMKYDIDAPIDENRISVFGSSVANGQGATDNTTNDLLNRYDDLIRDFGRYVIFGLSLGNEGIHGASNQQNVFNQWRDNMLKLINKVKADGKIPMVMNNYTRGDYVESDYSYVKQLNLLIHEWNVPSTNVLGSIDKGNGQWADGYVSDTYHQNTAGHAEFMYAMVPSLFDAIKSGKGQPVRNRTKSMTIEAGKTIYFEPEETLHPFTVIVRMKGTEGQVVSLTQASGQQHAIVRINADGTVTYTAPDGTAVTSTKAINDDNWHHVTLTSYYAQRRTILYVDKVKAGEVSQRLARIEEVSVGDENNSREVSELFFWRSGMTPEEVSAVCDGRMLKSSLEIYAPLGGKDDMENLAQSLNTLSYGKAAPKEYEKAAVGVTFFPDDGTAGFGSGENFDKLFDGSTSTKWCLNGGEGNPVHVIFHASHPIFVTGYKISTANDNAQYTGRNPKSWTLYGSPVDSNPGVDDPSWEVIASVGSDTQLKDVNYTTYTYKLPKETEKAYQSFKWVITSRAGGGNNVIQASEFQPTYTNALVEVDPVARPRVTINDQAEQDGKFFGTYVATTDVDFSGSPVTAYTGRLTEGFLLLEPVTAVPTGTALVVTAADPDTYPLTRTEGVFFIATNELLGSDGNVAGNGSVYTLAKADQGVGFYQVPQGDFVPQGKAYAVSNAGIKYFPLTDDPTGITLAPASLPFTRKEAYNLSGQRLSHPVQGLNIIDGKKITIR